MMGRSQTTLKLPDGYVPVDEIDLEKDKRLMLLVNGIAVAVMLVFALVGHLLVPFRLDFSADGGPWPALLRIGVMVVGLVVYIVLHELVHGVLIKYFSGEPAFYGFTGGYAYAGSKAYFAKRDYFMIALAPVVLWGVVLMVLNLLVPESWFWVVYMIQIGNLSGAAGDLYVVWRFSRLPSDVLILDRNVSMVVYAPQREDQI